MDSLEEGKRKRMEALRTLAQALAAVGPHGGSASTGGLSFVGCLLFSADRSVLHRGELDIDLRLRGPFGSTSNWIVQRFFKTEAAISAAAELGDSICYVLDVARLPGRRDAPPEEMNFMFLASAYQDVNDNEDRRGSGMVLWIGLFYDYFFISRTKSHFFFPPLCDSGMAYRPWLPYDSFHITRSILPCFHFPKKFAKEGYASMEDRLAPLPPGDYGARTGTDCYQILVKLPTGHQRFWAILQAEGSPIQDFPLHARSFTVADLFSGEENEGIDGRLGCIRPERYESHKNSSVSGTGAENGKFQIFIKTSTGNTILGWASAKDTGESLIEMIERKEGYSRNFFYILHEGSVLHENDRLRERQIDKNATLHVVFRMRGGSSGNRGTAGPSSYKDAARNKGTQSYKDAARSKGPQAETTTNVQPSPYIVEKLESTPVLEIKNPQVEGLFNTLQKKAVICRFNGFWPRSHDLHAWIYQNWTTNCQLLLCSKGFFVVQFETMDDYQKVFLQGPWFWGRAGLFITPWFPEFDANTMVVTKMPVWVRLPNLPLPYWHHQVLEDIGNLLGSFIKSDKERQDKGLFTYARICVEIDLSKGLPDRMHLKHASNIWLQRLDYENTAFRCRYCQLTGHLQDTCPLAKKPSKKKKGMRTNRKNWQADYVPSSDEEEGSEEEEQQEVPREEETMVSDDGEAQTTGNQTTGEDTLANMDNRVDALASSKKHTEDSLSDKGIQTALVIHEEAPISGIKRGHESEKSDSDKELPAKQKPEMVNGRQVVVATSSQGTWVEVKNKRKGKKGKMEDYYQS